MNKITTSAIVSMLIIQITGLTALSASAATFSDTSGHKDEIAIEYLKTKNVIQGYDDGTFRPNNSINRAELLKILVGGAGYAKPNETTYKNCFPDVKTQWFAPYVCFAKEKSWVSGYPDGYFRPEKKINKVEAMKMLVHSQGIPAAVNTESQTSVYTDVNLKLWFGQYMAVVEAMKIVDTGMQLYKPASFITRGEISSNIFRAMLILEQQVGSFDEVKVPGESGSGVQPPASLFNPPSLTISAKSPTSILLKIGAPEKTGTGSLTTYVLEYKTGNEQIYTPVDYAVEFYNTKEKTDGGILFTSKASTMYHFRIRAVNSNGQESVTSEVKTITTAAPLEPAAPTVKVLTQGYKSISLEVTLPTYTGDSALESIHQLFTDPNDGFTTSGSTNIEGNKIVGTWTAKYLLSPKLTDTVSPQYTFTFWVSNKNGKLSEKKSITVAGLSANPGRPTVTATSITKDSLTVSMLAPSYTGSTPLETYHYKIDSSSNPQATLSGGNYSIEYFEKEMKNSLGFGTLLPKTSYTISFWVTNFDGKKSDKITNTYTTL